MLLSVNLYLSWYFTADEAYGQLMAFMFSPGLQCTHMYLVNNPGYLCVVFGDPQAPSANHGVLHSTTVVPIDDFSVHSV